MDEQITKGNARAIGANYKGWFVGSFVQNCAQMQPDGVELKWGEHRAGEARAEWGASPLASCSILVSGRFRLVFRDREELLAEPGDFVIWQPGVEHTWTAEENSVLITVRWRPVGAEP